MMEESRAQGAEAGGSGVPPPRSFPVPRNRPVLVPVEEWEEECEDHQGSRRGRALLVSFLAALAAGGVTLWRALMPEPEPPAEPAPAVRLPSTDPAVETYYTPSQPEALPPVQEDATPLPVEPVSLDALFGKDLP